MFDEIDEGLARFLSAGKCNLFIGAGFSAEVNNFLTWGGFVEKLCRKLMNHEGIPEEEQETYLKSAVDNKTQFLDYAEKVHPNIYQTHLNGTLTSRYDTSKDVIISNVIEFSWNCIITTNLDKLIENGYADAGQDRSVISGPKDIPKFGTTPGVPIIKMHGCIGSPNDVVMTQSDYLRYEAESTLINSLVLTQMAKFPTVIVGAGLDDPNFIKINSLLCKQLENHRPITYYLHVHDVPSYIEKLWRPRGFVFIKLPKKGGLEEYFFGLRNRVNQLNIRNALRDQTEIIAKERKKILFSMLGEYKSYESAQRFYTLFNHLEDLNRFRDRWQNSLYGPLRKLVNVAIHDLPKVTAVEKCHFLYVAPGPHAPLFDNKDELEEFSRIVEKVTVLDIEQSIAESAMSSTIDKAKEAAEKLEVDWKQQDLTWGLGEYVSRALFETLRVKNVGETGQRIVQLESKLKGLFNSKKQEFLNNLDPHEIGKYQCVYSEMVASFMLTPALIAFRTVLYQSRCSSDSEDGIREVWKAAIGVWKEFNDLMFDFHLFHLGALLCDKGKLLVAFDTKKIYSSDLQDELSYKTEIYKHERFENLVQVQKQPGSKFYWRDHDTDYAFDIGGIAVDDYRAHEHEIEFNVYSKQRSNRAHFDIIAASVGMPPSVL